MHDDASEDSRITAITVERGQTCMRARHEDARLLALVQETVRRWRAYEGKAASRPPLTLDGLECGDLICWPHILGRPCTCGGPRARCLFLWRKPICLHVWAVLGRQPSSLLPRQHRFRGSLTVHNGLRFR